jgi:hypothetical protein
VDKPDVFSVANFHYADGAGPGFNGTCRADEKAAAATVAEFRKGQGRFGQNGNSVELADFLALAAKGALPQVNFRDLQLKLETSLDFGFEKRWALGSSTSQSRSCTGPSRAAARLVAMVVLPVPPLPLAMVMIMVSLS